MSTVEETRRLYDSTVLTRLAAVETLRLKARRALRQVFAAIVAAVDPRARARREIFLSFNASWVCVALPFDRALFEPRLSSSVLDFSFAEPYLKDLDLALGIVGDLDLNRGTTGTAAPGAGESPGPARSEATVGAAAGTSGGSQPEAAAKPVPGWMPARLSPHGPAPETNRTVLRGRGCGCTFLLLPVGLQLLFSVPAYFANEMGAVQTYLDLRGAITVTISPDSIDNGREGQLVYTTGTAATTAILNDPLFDISAPGLWLRRKVEMYQWHEVRPSGSTSGMQEPAALVYNKIWSETPIPSSSFKEAVHENPTLKPLASEMQIADRVTLGAFVLSPALVEKIGVVHALQRPALPPRWRGAGNKEWFSSGGYLYTSESSSNPPVGTVRVSFEIAEPTVVSVVARQEGNTLDAYTLGSGGAKKAVAKAGIHTPESLLEVDKLRARIMIAWKSRAGLIVAMTAAFFLILRPFAFFSDHLGPIMRILVEERTFLAAVLLSSFVVSLAVGFAWLPVLPRLGIPALLMSGAMLVGAVRFVRKRRLFEGGSPSA